MAKSLILVGILILFLVIVVVVVRSEQGKDKPEHGKKRFIRAEEENDQIGNQEDEQHEEEEKNKDGEDNEDHQNEEREEDRQNKENEDDNGDREEDKDKNEQNGGQDKDQKEGKGEKGKDQDKGKGEKDREQNQGNGGKDDNQNKGNGKNDTDQNKGKGKNDKDQNKENGGKDNNQNEGNGGKDNNQNKGNVGNDKDQNNGKGEKDREQNEPKAPKPTPKPKPSTKHHGSTKKPPPPIKRDDKGVPIEKYGYQEIKNYEGQVYYADDGTCGWWDSKANAYVQPALKYRAFDFKCLYDFHWHAFAPACGDPWYEKIKYCAKVKFFDNKMPDQWINEDNKDMLLVLIDGCLICEENSKLSTNPRSQQINATIRLNHTWPEGSFFSKCSEQNHTAGEFTVRLGAAPVDISEMKRDTKGKHSTRRLFQTGDFHYGAFAFPAILFQRQCQGLFGRDTPPRTFQNLTLIIEGHNCKGKDNERVVVPLPDISADMFKDNVAEIRGLHINMQYRTDAKQYSLVEFRYIEVAGREGTQVEWSNRKEPGDEIF